jgi:hypothetical protein
MAKRAGKVHLCSDTRGWFRWKCLNCGKYFHRHPHAETCLPKRKESKHGRG